MLTQTPPTFTLRATRAAWWSTFEILARYGVQFVVAVVLARLLDPADFGLMAMLLVFTTLAALLVDGGLGTALVQKQRTTPNDETTVFLASVGMAALLAVALWFAAPAIAIFYSRPPLTALMHLLLFVLPLGAMAAVPNAMLALRLDFRTRAGAELVASLVSGGLALILAWRGAGVWSLAWQAVVGAGMRTLMLWMLSGWRPQGRFDYFAFRQLFRFGGYVLLANAMNILSVRLQSLLIGRMFDARALGFYTLAQETQQAPAQFMSSLLNRVGMPVFSAIADRPDQLLGAMRLSLRVSMFVFVPCMTGIAALAEPIVAMLYGDRWAPAAPILGILALSAAFWPLHVLNLAAISALGRSDLVFRMEVVKGLTSIPLVVGASFFGVQAVAWAVLASSILCVVINTHYSGHLIGYGMLTQLRDQTTTFLLAVLSAAIAVAASRWAANPLLALLSGITLAVIAYCAIARLVNMAAWYELMELLKAVRAPRQGRMSRGAG